MHKSARQTVEFGNQSKQGVTLTLPLTHQDIADMLGTTRETVTKAAVKLRENGIIAPDRRFRIIDIGALEKAAYS